MSEKRFNLSRRKALAALGTIGVASAGAGLGTSAYFSDQETFENNQLTAGTLDMKVAATEYYSDWSTDEAEYADMAADEASTDIRLPPSDDQPDAQAIALDLDDSYDGEGDVYGAFLETIETGNDVNGGISAANDGGLCGTESDADGPVIIDIGDVKPGDFGGAQFAFELCTNPGLVWLNGSLVSANENGLTEPEADDPDEEDGVVELLDEIQVAYGVGPINGDTSAFNDTDSGFQPTNQQSLREFLESVESGDGIPLSGDTDAPQGGGSSKARNCFAGETVHEVSLVWWLPIDHGNQVQSDSATFNLGFYTEQCRHNGGDGVVVESDATGGIRETDNWITATVSPGLTTTITIELDGEVYGSGDSGLGEWPSNDDVYFMEANIDVDNDGLEEDANTDDFRVGFAAANSGARANAISGSSTASGAGGYIRRNTGGSNSGDPASRADYAEEDIDGFSATESADQLTYTIEIDWTSDDLPDLSSAPSAIKINEVFGGDGGEGVGATPNSSNDGRGDIDNVTGPSGTLQF